MPAVDFRTLPFGAARAVASGKYVGRRSYWKLYAAENTLRVIVHSVLRVQIGPDWWAVAVDSAIQKQAERFARRHEAQPWHSGPGSHGIYFTFLHDLGEIMRANSHLFTHLIPTVDQWIARIEQVRLPRNIVGHMNFPGSTDRKRIDVFYDDVEALAKQLAAAGLSLEIP